MPYVKMNYKYNKEIRNAQLPFYLRKYVADSAIYP